MSLFQCEECGCVENTALCNYWSRLFKEDKRKLCCVCSDSGRVWHGKFERAFLPKGMFITNGCGNLEHIETGLSDYMKYKIDENT